MLLTVECLWVAFGQIMKVPQDVTRRALGATNSPAGWWVVLPSHVSNGLVSKCFLCRLACSERPRTGTAQLTACAGQPERPVSVSVESRERTHTPRGRGRLY